MTTPEKKCAVTVYCNCKKSGMHNVALFFMIVGYKISFFMMFL